MEHSTVVSFPFRTCLRHQAVWYWKKFPFQTFENSPPSHYLNPYSLPTVFLLYEGRLDGEGSQVGIG